MEIKVTFRGLGNLAVLFHGEGLFEEEKEEKGEENKSMFLSEESSKWEDNML